MFTAASCFSQDQGVSAADTQSHIEDFYIDEVVGDAETQTRPSDLRSGASALTGCATTAAVVDSWTLVRLPAGALRVCGLGLRTYT